MSGIPPGLSSALADRYRIERQLGQGGMATVYLAQDLKHERRVAIKVLRPELGATLGPERFVREIKLTAQLTHPHILPLLESGEADGLLFYVMPYVEGESLRDRLDRERQLPIEDAVRIAREVADALDAAHRQGVVHRDIKPENILLSGGRAVVADFGIARAVTAAGGEKLTQTGMAVGTPLYMSPEQALGQGVVDGRSDIYSLACVLYEMLVGHSPFSGSTAHEVLARHAMDPVPPLRTARATVPEALETAIEKALAKVPADRFATAAAFGEALAAGVAAPPVPGSRIQPALTAAGLFALASLAVIGLVYGLMLWLGLPDWVPPAATVLLAIGLPIVLVTALLEGRSPMTTRLGLQRRGAAALFTWRRALVGGGVAFSGLGAVTAAYMTMRTLGVGSVGTLMAGGALHERDRLIVADFDNRTGDSLMAVTVAGALRVDLAQSRVVRVLDPTVDVRPALLRMRRDPRLPLDAELARQIAIREGAKAVVAGDVSAAGAGFLLSARLLGVDSGQVLAAMRETASDASEVIDAIDRLSGRLRERIGESLRDVRASPPLARVTTSSLEALRLFTQAARAGWREGDYRRAILLLEQAVALDPLFANAYRVQAIALGNMGVEPARRESLVTKAFELRDRLPDLERYAAEANYWRMKGDDDRAVTAWHRMLEIQPDHEAALTWLGFTYERQRDFQHAEEMFLRAYEATANQWLNNIADQQLFQGKVEAARATVAKLKAEFPNAQRAPYQAYEAAVAYASGDDSTALAHWQALYSTELPDKPYGALGSAGILTRLGKLREAASYFEYGVALLERGGWGQGGALDYVGNAAWQAQVDAQLRTDPEQGVRRLDEALSRFPVDSLTTRTNPGVLLNLGIAYAFVGQLDRAKALMAEYERAVPDSSRRRPELLGLRGHIALFEGRGPDAVREFRRSVPGPDPYPAPLPLLGQAFELVGQPDSAIAVYEQYFTGRMGPVWCCFANVHQLASDALWRAWLHRRLGELYEARGNHEQAVDHYNRFVELWKDADPELQPQVREVRERLARLLGEPQRR